MLDYHTRTHFPALSEIEWRARCILGNPSEEHVAKMIGATMAMIDDFKSRQHEVAMDRFISERTARLYSEGGWELAYLESVSSHVPGSVTEEDIERLLRNWPDYAHDKPDFPIPLEDFDALVELIHDGYPYDAIDGFEEVGEADLYAALALATVRAADSRLAAERWDINGVTAEYPWAMASVLAAGTTLVKAMEILCTAEAAPKAHWAKEEEQREERQRKASQQARTALAQRGASARAERYRPLRDLSKELVQAKKYRSVRSAVLAIAPAIVARSKELGLNMSEAQAASTITGWLKEMGLPAKMARQQANIER